MTVNNLDVIEKTKKRVENRRERFGEYY